jgi:hypothetical protein
MTKQYKEVKIEEPNKAQIIQPIFLNKTIGSAFLDLTSPNSIPTGDPKNFSEQIQYTLVELSPVTAGSFNSGVIYKISTLGTTDFTLIGANKNETGIYFTATGSGSGTGVATEYKVRTYFYIPQFKVWKYVDLL